MHADLDFYLSDEITPPGTRLPVTVTNKRNPGGILVSAWNTGINPQSDIYAHFYSEGNDEGKVISAESGIMTLEYDDGLKQSYYHPAYPNKESVWVFDTNRTDFRTQVDYYDWGQGLFYMKEPPDAGYAPNAPLGQLTALNKSTVNPMENIGYGTNVSSFQAAANLGNYGIKMEYTVTFYNSGATKVVAYYMEGQGNYVIEYNGALLNKGETQVSTTEPMASFIVPHGTKTVTFSVVLISPNSGSINNWLKVIY